MGRRGLLVVAATPIGNTEDASPRLAEALADADVVAAEDTRRVRRLAAALGVSIRGQIRSCFDASERLRVQGIVSAIRSGQTVLLVSDAGVPTVSDPGYRIVAAVADAGLPVTVLPGPSAVTAALAVSGLPTDRFCFEGFLPRKSGERMGRIGALACDPRTVVLMESRHRLARTIADLAAGLGRERRAVLCRELTKTHEEIVRGDLGMLADWAAVREEGPIGEVTLVIAGVGGRRASAAAPGPRDDDRLAQAVGERVAGGESRRDAIAAVARATGIPRRLVYRAAVGATQEAAPPAPP